MEVRWKLSEVAQHSNRTVCRHSPHIHCISIGPALSISDRLRGNTAETPPVNRLTVSHMMILHMCVLHYRSLFVDCASWTIGLVAVPPGSVSAATEGKLFQRCLEEVGDGSRNRFQADEEFILTAFPVFKGTTRRRVNCSAHFTQVPALFIHCADSRSSLILVRLAIAFCRLAMLLSCPLKPANKDASPI